MRLAAAQLDGQTCGLAEMAAALLADAPDLGHDTKAYETLEVMRAAGSKKTRVARGTAHGGP
jgi:hypothetical protein